MEKELAAKHVIFELALISKPKGNFTKKMKVKNRAEEHTSTKTNLPRLP
jgi:hypothetical protein